MDTKPLLYGLVGFFIGGFLVSVAATTFDKPETESSNNNKMNMSQMVNSLKDRSGDEYDKAFINEMIMHHQSAVAMASLSADRAKNDEIKLLSNDIIKAQEKEINQMKQWQKDWGYGTDSVDGSMSDM